MIPHSKPWMGDEEAEAAARVVRSGMLAQGREVEAFEAECAAAVGRAHAVAVSSGTAALYLALRALGVSPSSTVAIPAYACSAIPNAAVMAGLSATPVDVDRDGNMLADAVPAEAAAAIVVHLFGMPAQLPKEDTTVIEDLAQSIGGGTGRSGQVAIASFYATKMLTTGEGGMVLTDDEGLAEAVRDLREYDKRGDGKARFNWKMTDIQAAIGRVQLGRLDGFIARRREIAARYTEAWRDLPLVLPGGEGHVFYRYAVRVKGDPFARPHAALEKEARGSDLEHHPAAGALMEHLRAAGIDAKAPVHPPGALANGLPGAAAAYTEFVSIPLYPALTDDEVRQIIEVMQKEFA